MTVYHPVCEAIAVEAGHKLLSALADIDTHDVNLRDHAEAWEAMERYNASLSTPPQPSRQSPPCPPKESRAMTDRTPAEYAIEHGEYLAAGAEHLIDSINALDYAIEMEYSEAEIAKAQEVADEARSALRVDIYEFRKRRLRALATPAPAQPDPLHVANERGEGWQPIESAPKSPVPVLLFTRGGIIRIETGWYAVNLLAEAIENGEECAFTHWAPLPAAPKEKP